MHERDSFTSAAPNYRYGFLAAALHQVLGKPIGSQLEEEERRQLSLGRAFLADVLAGVSLVSRGETKAASPTRAIGVLDFALGPLLVMERLRDQQEEGVLRFFEDVIALLDQSLAAGRISGEVDRLAEAREFFGHLSEDFLATLNRQRDPHAPGGRAALM